MSFSGLLKTIPREGRVQLPGGQTDGFIRPAREDEERREQAVLEDRPRFGDEYAEKYRQEEEEEELRMLEASKPVAGKKSDNLCEVDDLTSMGTMPNLAQLRIDDMDNTLFNDYRLMVPTDLKHLPVFQYQVKFLALVNSNPVVIVRGKTGCGKSTQLPLMILDDHAQRRQFCNIIVTQPRRIAAKSIATAVCKTYNINLGALVGYQIGLDKEVDPRTRLTYCTTGVLLQKLIAAKNMDEYTHIILDEVHERAQDMDFLMLLVRKLQRTNSRNVKLILMSATIDVDNYANYFSRIVNNSREAAPVMEISKETAFKVQIYYTDHLISKLGTFPESTKGEHDISPEAYDWVVKLIKAFDFLDEYENKKNVRGSVLVFLPGIHEIESMFEALQRREDGLWWICPLHSTLTSEEQFKAFQPPLKGHRKVILSTNIAESSITVNDIKYVIDFCLTKVMKLDHETNLSCLRLCSASKNMCEQRAGRAGRVMDGRVYRLVSEHHYKTMEQESTPEMLTASLDLSVLKAKQLDMGEPKKILAMAMDPPDLTNIKKTILKLKELGALYMKVGKVYKDDDGDLTVMGDVMGSLPIDPPMTKLILLGHAFNLLNDAIIMACSMSVKSMFSRPFKKDLEAYLSKCTWADSLTSDPIAYLNAYNTWRSLLTSGKFNISNGESESMWAKRYFIQIPVIREVARLVEDVTDRLKRFNVVPSKPPKSTPSWTKLKQILLKMILAGACYPNFFFRGDLVGQQIDREAVKLLGSRDPANTVYLSNFALGQPGPLYSNAIKKLFSHCGVPTCDIKVSFDGSSRVYVEFKSDCETQKYDGSEKELSSKISCTISMAVYRALKMRHGKVPLQIPMLTVSEANKRVHIAREKYRQKKKCSQEAVHSVLPPIDSQYLDIAVTHINDISNFYVQQKNPYTLKRLNDYHVILNKLVQLKKAPHVVVNELYAAPFFQDDTRAFYRCKVLSIDKRSAQIMYVDYGNIEKVDVTFLFLLPNRTVLPSKDGPETTYDLKTEPPLAFRCRLAGAMPKRLHRTNQVFSEMCLFQGAVGKVYSVVDSVVSLEILVVEGNSSSYRSREDDYINVNRMLVERGLADQYEESFLSKMNHDRRVKHQSKFNSYNNVPEDVNNDGDETESNQTLFDNDDDLDMKSPTFEETHSKMILKGPFSPLEMKIHGCLRTTINKCISIESDSINSVLLDEQPDNPHDRMVVAAHVSRSAGGQRLNLRHTTVILDCNGMSALMCLLFSPVVELRTDEKFSRLTGAICGLGYDPQTKQSYFPEHDFEIAFDTVFTIKQIEQINKFRLALSGFLAPHGESNYFNMEFTKTQADFQEMIDEAFHLIANQPIERVKVCNSYKWGQIPEDLIMLPGKGDTWQNPLIYQLIFGIDLTPPRHSEFEKMRNEFQRNINELVKIKDGLQTFKPINCELCQVPIENIQVLTLHFMSKQHAELSKRFKLNNSGNQ
ncbi:ATP-dependent RNA helicase TDRD9 isoform X2 [Nilaparvata lugens]|uniref:ATP-dependent RNA helicase TDRD9 isoform X1 n=1 Tax=Nilaparvata lugens TaxID=108931 RepID=UPI00193D7F7B|nr:ATP-dependent RNA helicase TDRD9 isoform X1 [Nilaparvata lugens]XP_039282201.1 ATP-dependent RNA helicase TDRD9 isoform X2 [Nilaparvata lugens]